MKSSNANWHPKSQKIFRRLTSTPQPLYSSASAMVLAQHVVSDSMIYDDDEGGDVILDSLYINPHSIDSQLPKTIPNGTPAKATAPTSGRRVYTKQFLLSKLAMGSEFEGPLIVVPRKLSDKQKSKLQSSWSREQNRCPRVFSVVVDRIRNLVRQNSRNPYYFTPEQLAQVYQNVHGEPIPELEALCSKKDSITHPKHTIMFFYVPDITVEFYPKSEVTKIFWNGQDSRMTEKDE